MTAPWMPPLVRTLILLGILVMSVFGAACHRRPAPRRSAAPQGIPVLFHVEPDFLVVEVAVEGYTGNLRCLQRIDRFAPPLTGYFKDERCYWVPSEWDAGTPGGLLLESEVH